MKRKTTSTPTRVHTYGCSYRGIITNAELAEDQYRRAYVYQQKLVELELKRRAAVRSILGSAPDVVALAQTVATCEAEVEAAVLLVKTVRKAGRTRMVPPELADRLARAKSACKDARAAVKTAQAVSALNPEIRSALDKINSENKADVKAARQGSGLTAWGTYLIIDKAAEQQRNGKMDPRHRPYNGEGRLAVQFQKGTTVDKLFGDDTRMQIAPKLGGSPKRHMCKIRIASNGRAPVWAEIEVFIHRPLPPDSRITWAWLQRVRRGRDYTYSLQITVESATFLSVSTGRKRVAVDLGWRVADRGANGLRVAYWQDSNGEHGELRLDAKLLSALDYPAQLSGIETKWFEQARSELAAWLAATPHPEEHAARTANLASWRSAMRLASYVWWWRLNRFAGDAAMYAQMNEWRVRRFWHYRDWALHQRDSAFAARKDLYRNFARHLLHDCRELALEDFDLRAFARKTDDTPSAQRFWRMMGSPHELRLCLISAAKKAGVLISKLDPAMTTRRCHACGNELPWDQEREVAHTCAICGVTWDQDQNACINLLASGSVMPPVPEALASSESTPEIGGENSTG
jgi:predicted RNA-binding Zn-ribbon protein involved in translation (DUF1610 family)